jgi:spermidine/putrescine transport system ATP-binding protein
VSLNIRAGEFFSLLGPSGCGKTTLLRVIAGLEVPDAGTLRIGGVDAAQIPAHRRPVNTVFQSYALFPHLTVRDNVAFGLRMKKVPSAQIAQRVERVLSLTQITELAQRRPAQLSGGQKQRVALARALVNEPAVLLLDEPLGALDLKLRKQLQVELHQLQRRLGITFIHVTHDQDEALVMSDRIAVMNEGRIEQLDEAQALYERPRTRFVAQFLGSCNLIQAVLTGTTAGMVLADTPLGPLRAKVSEDAAALRDRKEVTLAIRPEKIALTRGGAAGAPNTVTARVTDLVYSGAETQYRFEVAGQTLNAVALNSRAGHQGFHAGETVSCHLPETSLIILDD